MKILVIIGTRPEAIKLAPVIIELNKRVNMKSVVCVTAQHRQMLDQPLELFCIKPKYDLDIMRNKQSLAQITSRSIEGLNKVFTIEKPDWALVQGDTSSDHYLLAGPSRWANENPGFQRTQVRG